MITIKSFKALLLNTLSAAGLLLLPFVLLFVAVNDNFGCSGKQLVDSDFIQSMRAGFVQTYGSDPTDNDNEIGIGSLIVKGDDIERERTEAYIWMCDWSSGQHMVQIAFNREMPEEVLQELVAIVAERKDQLSGEEPYVAVMPEMSVRRPDGSVIQWHDGPVTVLSLEFRESPSLHEASEAASDAILLLYRIGTIKSPHFEDL